MYQRHDQAIGLPAGAGGAATLSLGAALPPTLLLRTPVDRPTLHQRFAAAIGDAELVVDLGARIGTAEWLRGLVTCSALCVTAWSLAPDLQALPGPPAPALPESQWDEARSIGIAPLALGADTGRRMAATDAVEPLAETPERPSIDLTATIGRGDGFARVLERAGVATGQAREVAAMVDRAVAIDDIKPGTRLAITLGRRPNRKAARPLDSLTFRARFDLSLAVERVDGALALRRIPIAIDHTPLRIQGRVGSSLYVSMLDAGVPAKARQAYLKAIGSRLDVGRDIGRDARFDVIIEHDRAETGEVEIGDILYVGLTRGKRELRLMRWSIGGRAEWFEASGQGETRGAMARPVVGHQTSGFGMRRHPLLGYSRMHKGMDFGAPYGAPIVAATDGTVAFAGRNRGYGNFVRLTHGGGLATAYAHMSRIAVAPGARVSMGQVIGYIGSTGLSTGPHLHYEVYRNGVAINPATIKFVTTSRLAGADLARFKATLSGLLAVKMGAARPAAPKTETAASGVAGLVKTKG